MVYLVPPMVLPPLLTGQVAGWLPEPVWTLSKSEIPYILESNQHYKFDVWLAVHRSSMWNKKPTRCHLVLYLFLLYKLLNMFRATLCPSLGADDLVVFLPRVV